MAIHVTMPKWGLTMKKGKITKWFKREGDQLQKGDPFFEVETEKITNTVEATSSGILFQIIVEAGTEVPVGTIVAIISEAGEEPERIEGLRIGEEVEDRGPTSDAPAPSQAEKAPEKKFVLASPAARRLAKEMGVDLTQVKGTGPKGRVSEADVTRYHEVGPPAPKITPLAKEMLRQADLDISKVVGSGKSGKITRRDVEQAIAARRQEEEAAPMGSIPFTGMRKIIAGNMHASLQNTAQLTIFSEVDVTEMIRFRDLVRQEYKNDKAVKVSYNDIIIMATSKALKRFPIMNSTLVGDEILLHDSVHMGIAVALSEGLIVPVLRDSEKKGLLEIAREARKLARKAQEGALTVDDVTGGTFTISNLSMFQVDGVTPILKPPETGILGVGRVMEKPAVFNGEIAIRSMMFLNLTFDHRVVDGAPASEFLGTVARYLEHPYLNMAY